MKVRTLLRTSGAVWVAPIVLILVVAYYHATSWTGAVYGWAPTVVAKAELTTVPFAYATAAGLGVWESGRLTAGAIWQLAPVRSRYRIAAEVLAPIVALTWLMHLLVVGVALAHARVVPTLDGLRALAISMPLCVAYSVLGFAVGLRVNRHFAAPIFAALVWIMTAMAWSIGLPWPRQMSGVFPVEPDFGEVISWHAVIPHLAAAGGVAVGAALLWLPNVRAVRLSLAAIVALAGLVGSYAMVRDWGYSPPMATGQAVVVCVGESPRVCMPKVTSGSIWKVRSDVASMVTDLDRLGVGARPETVADSLLRSRGVKAAGSVLYVPLTGMADGDSIRLAVMMSSIKFPCKDPIFPPEQAARMWVAQRTGLGAEFEALLARQLAMSVDPDKIVGQVAAVVDNTLAMSADEQRRWYLSTIQAACAGIR